MAQDEETQYVVVSIGVSLTKEVVEGYRQMSSNRLSEYSDTEIVKYLAADILTRYFTEEYIDVDSLMV